MAQPSTHILKPDHPGEDYPHSVANEWFIMSLAARLGIQVPGVYRRYIPEPVYIIERFDRWSNEVGWQRRHVIDACQLRRSLPEVVLGLHVEPHSALVPKAAARRSRTYSNQA